MVILFCFLCLSLSCSPSPHRCKTSCAMRHDGDRVCADCDSGSFGLWEYRQKQGLCTELCSRCRYHERILNSRDHKLITMASTSVEFSSPEPLLVTTRLDRKGRKLFNGILAATALLSATNQYHGARQNLESRARKKKKKPGDKNSNQFYHPPLLLLLRSVSYLRFEITWRRRGPANSLRYRRNEQSSPCRFRSQSSA